MIRRLLQMLLGKWPWKRVDRYENCREYFGEVQFCLTTKYFAVNICSIRYFKHYFVWVRIAMIGLIVNFYYFTSIDGTINLNLFWEAYSCIDERYLI